MSITRGWSVDNWWVSRFDDSGWGSQGVFNGVINVDPASYQQVVNILE